MFIISKEFHFSASHILKGLPEDHQCGRLHGHNYVITVHLSGETLDDVGFVEDYGALKDVKNYIDDNLDHKHLNDYFAFNPTAENMAKFFYLEFTKTHPKICGVSVKETPKTNAYYGEVFNNQ